jgi:hemolysin activation/secretion protein
MSSSKSGRAQSAPALLPAVAAAAGLLLPSAAAAQVPSGTAPGQTTGRVAPKLPAPSPPPEVTAPSAAPSAEGNDQAVLLPSLKGLVFVAGMQGLQTEGVSESAVGASGLAAPGLPLLGDPGFAAQMRAHLGKPLRMADLKQIRDETRAWFAAHKHPFVDVVAPPQNITSGVVQIVVSEYRLGDVEVVGARHFSDRLILAPLDLEKGQTISLDQLQDNVDRLNENPFLSVDAEFRPGAEPGSTDLVLRATDRLPVRVYAGYDNQGVPTLDRREWNVGVNWGNAFGTGQIVSYQFTRSVNGRFTSHSVSDVIRLDNSNKLLVFGNYATMRSAAYLWSLLGPLEFDSDGHSKQASVRLVHALPRWRSVTGHIQIGYDYKATDNNSFFGEIQLGPPSLAATNQFPLILDGQEADRFGSTAIENDLVYAPGRLTPHDNDADFQLLAAGARARYVYDRLSLTRTTRLPRDFSLIGRLIVQRSSAILPNSEQLGGGGVGSVRGYDPDTALGSNGELASVELRGPAFSIARQLGWRRLQDLAQLGVFYDYASLRQPHQPHDPLSGAIASTALPVDLASTGTFLHYSIGRNVDLNFDMGFQLRRAPLQSKLGSYGAVAIVVSH